jgi:hypothetical protein
VSTKHQVTIRGEFWHGTATTRRSGRSYASAARSLAFRYASHAAFYDALTATGLDIPGPVLPCGGFST